MFVDVLHQQLVKNKDGNVVFYMMVVVSKIVVQMLVFAQKTTNVVNSDVVVRKFPENS